MHVRSNVPVTCLQLASTSSDERSNRNRTNHRRTTLHISTHQTHNRWINSIKNKFKLPDISLSWMWICVRVRVSRLPFPPSTHTSNSIALAINSFVCLCHLNVVNLVFCRHRQCSTSFLLPTYHSLSDSERERQDTPYVQPYSRETLPASECTNKNFNCSQSRTILFL